VGGVEGVQVIGGEQKERKKGGRREFRLWKDVSRVVEKFRVGTTEGGKKHWGLDGRIRWGIEWCLNSDVGNGRSCWTLQELQVRERAEMENAGGRVSARVVHGGRNEIAALLRLRGSDRTGKTEWGEKPGGKGGDLKQCKRRWIILKIEKRKPGGRGRAFQDVDAERGGKLKEEGGLARENIGKRSGGLAK